MPGSGSSGRQPASFYFLYGEEDAFRCCWAGDVDGTARTARRDGVANCFPHGKREHEGRLTHGLAAEDHVRIVGAVEKAYVEDVGQFRPGWQFICGRAACRKPALRDPTKVLQWSAIQALA